MKNVHTRIDTATWKLILAEYKQSNLSLQEFYDTKGTFYFKTNEHINKKNFCIKLSRIFNISNGIFSTTPVKNAELFAIYKQYIASNLKVSEFVRSHMLKQFCNFSYSFLLKILYEINNFYTVSSDLDQVVNVYALTTNNTALNDTVIPSPKTTFTTVKVKYKNTTKIEYLSESPEKSVLTILKNLMLFNEVKSC